MSKLLSERRLARVLSECSPLLKYLEHEVGISSLSVHIGERTLMISWDDSQPELNEKPKKLYDPLVPGQVFRTGPPTS